MNDLAIQLSDDGGKHLYEQIYEYIRDEIKEGKLLLLLLNDTFQDVNQIVNVIDLNVSFQYHIFQIN